MRTTALAGLMLLASTSASGQPAPPSPPKEKGAFAEALGKEAEKIKESCSTRGWKVIGTCAATLATAQPLHIAFGNLAPQSGLGLGLALVGHKNLETKPFRLYGSADGVVTPGGSWRAGAYMNVDRVRKVGPDLIGVEHGTAAAAANAAGTGAIDDFVPTVYSAYVQSTSLDRLLFFGLGPDSHESEETRWGMTETIVGGRIVKPLSTKSSGLTLVGGLNGRFTSIRSSHSDPEPSIEQVYNEVTAPGLRSGTALFVQITARVRMEPSWFGKHVHPFYSLTVDQFVAGSSLNGGFTRGSLELTHEFPLYKRRRFTNEGIGPNECSPDGTCPPVSNDRDGSVVVRFVTSAAWPTKGDAVPFYFQPTLGGGNINGESMLAGFKDYRFRGPNVIALQERFDHSLPFWGPLGVLLMAEQGKVALRPGDLGLSRLKQSFSAGLTLRAGGFPEVFLLFGWSREGRHLTFAANPSLLGGSSRPSLY
jgi:hypothetical protein